MQPRLGFASTPFGQSTVVRGGFGLFSDAFPASVVDSFAQNAPLDNQFSGGRRRFADRPGQCLRAGGGFQHRHPLSNFSNGGTWASIYGSDPTAGPGFYVADPKVYTPTYEEWNLQLQHSFGAHTMVSANYVGNHGYHLAIVNNGLNGYGMPGLPAGPVDPRFTTVSQLQSAGVSNYNGLTLSFNHRFSSKLFKLNSVIYTWGQALDDVSNGGLSQFNYATNVSILNPENPYNLKQYNYGNADYDVRHSFNLNYVWDVPFNQYLRVLPAATRGWTVSGTLFVRSGLPFTVIDTAATGDVTGNNYGGTLFANWNGSAVSCTSAAVDTPCMSSQFSSLVGANGSDRFWQPAPQPVLRPGLL